MIRINAFNIFRRITALLMLLLFGFTSPIPKDNKGKIEFLRKQIKQTEELLRNLNKDKNNFITQIKARQGLIDHRNELILGINKELLELSSQLSELEQRNKIGLEKLGVLRTDYESSIRKKFIAKILRQDHPIVSNVEWKLVLIKKIWFEQLNKFHISRFLKYKSSQQDILNQQNEIKSKILRQSELLNSQMIEKYNLEKDIEGLQRDYRNIELKTKDFSDMIVKFNREQKQLEDIVNSSINNVQSNIGIKKYYSTGSLAYPIKNASVVSRFGNYKDRNNPQITLKNNGIDLRSEDSFVSSVSESKVQQIKQLVNGTFVIICSRDNYFFVYSNLDKVFVKPGEMIHAQSNIGELKLNLQGTYELHFEVWRDKTPLDPMKFFRDVF